MNIKELLNQPGGIRAPRVRGRVNLAYPSAIEAKYFSHLVDYVKRLRKVLDEQTGIFLPLIESEVAAEKTIRQDAWPQDVMRMLSIIRKEFDVMKRAVGPLIEGVADEVSEFELRQWQSTMQKIVGIELYAAESWLRDELQAFTIQNVELIHKLTDDLASDVGTIVNSGFRAGKRHETIRNELLGTNLEGLDHVPALRKVENRAKLIARDQVAKLNSELNHLRQEQVGLELYVWRTSLDERVRASHDLLDGMYCKWDDAIVYSQDGVNWKPRTSSMFHGHPGEDYQCRCVAEPVFEIPERQTRRGHEEGGEREQ